MVEDIINFYWGNYRPVYLWGTQSIRVGSDKNYKRALLVYWVDPPLIDITHFNDNELTESHTNWSVLTEDHLELALSAVRRGAASRSLCCPIAIDEAGVGAGCTDDMDLILQYALFEEVRYG